MSAERILKGEVQNMIKEKIIVFTRAATMFEAVKNALKAESFDLVKCEVKYQNTEELAGILDVEEPTLIFIDSDYESDDKTLLKQLSQMRLIELRQALVQHVALPASLGLLHAVKQLRDRNELKNLLVFYFADDPSVALTQEILRMGADWIWPHRTSLPNTMGSLIENLRTIMERPLSTDKNRARFLVVENSKSTCRRIKVELEDLGEVSFVGTDKPGDMLEIEPEEVLDKFRAGSFDVIIMDLALKVKSEEWAREHLMTEGDAYQLIVERDELRLMQKVLGGLVAIKEIRKNSSDIPIFVFSFFVQERFVMALMKAFLGEHLYATLTMLPKHEGEFKNLHAFVEQELKSKTKK